MGKASPVNGVPPPRGKPFTSDSAREAAKKRAETLKAKKSIRQSLLRFLCENSGGAAELDPEGLTWAERIALALVTGAAGASGGKPDLKFIEAVIELVGEQPDKKQEAAAAAAKPLRALDLSELSDAALQALADRRDGE